MLFLAFSKPLETPHFTGKCHAMSGANRASLTTLDFCEAEFRCLVTLRHFLLDEENIAVVHTGTGDRPYCTVLLGHESMTRQLLKCMMLEVTLLPFSVARSMVTLILRRVPKDYSLPGRTDRCTCEPVNL
jgi:hypothetical protein